MKAPLRWKPRYSYEPAYRTDEEGNRWNVSRWAPGIASEFIQHLPKLVRKDGRRAAVLYVRVSSDDQRKNGNLDEATESTQQRLGTLGCPVIETFAGVESSSISYDDGRPLLYAAIQCARKHRAILVAQSRDRFLRHKAFSKTNSTELPVVSEYQKLCRMAEGVTLATLDNPDEPTRSTQIKRGQEAKGTPIGRPRLIRSGPGQLKRRKKTYLPLAVRMRAQGWTYRRIADELNARNDGMPKVSFKTVSNWTQKRAKPV